MPVGDLASIGLRSPDADADINTYSDEHAHSDEYPNTHTHPDKHAHSNGHVHSDEYTDPNKHTYARASARACWLGDVLCQQFLFGSSREVGSH